MLICLSAHPTPAVEIATPSARNDSGDRRLVLLFWMEVIRPAEWKNAPHHIWCGALRLFGGFLCGLLTLSGDLLKGFVPVQLYMHNAGTDAGLALVLAAPVLGHAFPLFYGFRGGKGVATILGAGTGIYTPILMMCFGVWCFVFAIWHYVSLASMVAGCCYPTFVLIFSTMTYDPAAPFQSIPFIIFSWVVAVLLVVTHRKNIGRLREGTESKIYLWGGPDDDTNKNNANK